MDAARSFCRVLPPAAQREPMSLQPVCHAAAAWDFLGLGRWEEEGRAPSCKSTAGSDHPTSASHLPMLWGDDISSRNVISWHFFLWNYGSLQSLHVTFKNHCSDEHQHKGLCSPWEGGHSWVHKPPGCGRVHPKGLLHSSLNWKGPGRGKRVLKKQVLAKEGCSSEGSEGPRRPLTSCNQTCAQLTTSVGVKRSCRVANLRFLTYPHLVHKRWPTYNLVIFLPLKSFPFIFSHGSLEVPLVSAGPKATAPD